VSNQKASQRARRPAGQASSRPQGKPTRSPAAAPAPGPVTAGVGGRPWRPYALGAICLAGIGISIYLLIVHYAPSALICSNSGVVDCSSVLKSPSSEIFSIPVPYFGLAYFIAMGVICLPAAWRSEAAWLAWGRIAGVVAGIGMVVYLVYQEAIVLHKICLWCTGVHVLTFIMFLVVVSGWETTGYALSRWED